jgi:hypothetical protein
VVAAPADELGRETKEYRVGHCKVTIEPGFLPDKKTLF